MQASWPCYDVLFFTAECCYDVVFLLDRSDSIEKSNIPGERPNWELLLAFTQALVDNFTIGSEETRVAAVTFGDQANIQFRLDEYFTADDIKAALAAIEYKSENTNTTGGIWVTRNDILIEDAGARDDIDDIIIMVTAGKPTRDVEMLPDEIAKLRAEGIRLIVIGIGEANETFLTTLVESESDYFYLESFAALSGIAEIVTQTIHGTLTPIDHVTTPDAAEGE